MAGPLSGITGQQVPFATTFKPGGNQQDSVIQQKLDEATQKAANGQTQVQGAESSSAPVSQGADSAKTRDDRSQGAAESFSSNDNGDNISARRGSLVDIAV